MPDLRHDPLTNRWVIIAAERANRPQDFAAVQSTRTRRPCPFCAGHEAATPEEVLALRPPGSPPAGPDWQVRVVPNKYPVLQPAAGSGEGQPTSDPRIGQPDDPPIGQPDDPPPLAASQPACGVHEVIIESPRHATRTTQLTSEEFQQVILAYRHRLRAARQLPGLAYGLIFKNVGPRAGATIEHLHSQLVAMPWVPPQVQQELSGAEAFYQAHRQCVFCHLIQQEDHRRQRMVASAPQFVAFCPYASFSPYETWIVPREHGAAFDEMSDDQATQLARILRGVLDRMDHVLQEPAYNYLVHSAPFDERSIHSYHWRVVVFPRITTLAGFEWATGCGINPIAPEKAAQQLKFDALL